MGTCEVSLIVCCTQPSFALCAFYVHLYILVSLLRLFCDAWTISIPHKSPLYTTHCGFLSINEIFRYCKFCTNFTPPSMNRGTKIRPWCTDSTMEIVYHRGWSTLGRHPGQECARYQLTVCTTAHRLYRGNLGIKQQACEPQGVVRGMVHVVQEIGNGMVTHKG
ncbi:hypothetical protein K474DRAFT_596239 [Panus rudis PR-1116 ss-1]|nr:hypothetical protein K474DRAFT_596239 [Panus rudis PR-1116 ss-1]